MSVDERQRLQDEAVENPLGVCQQLRLAAREAKVAVEALRMDDLRIHDLRRTLGSWLAEAGAGQWVIGKVLGHQSAQSSAPYARVGVPAQRQWVTSTVGTMLTADPASPLRGAPVPTAQT